MSMREYGIQGYGISIDQVANYIDRKKLVDFLYGDEIDTVAEGVSASNTELVEQCLMEQDSIVEYCYADSTDVTGYILIYKVLPWEMYHKDYKDLTTEGKAKEYIWEHVKEFFDDRLVKEDFMYMCDYIDDTYLG